MHCSLSGSNTYINTVQCTPSGLPNKPAHELWVRIVYVISEGSSEPVHLCRLIRASAARAHKSRNKDECQGQNGPTRNGKLLYDFTYGKNQSPSMTCKPPGCLCKEFIFRLFYALGYSGQCARGNFCCLSPLFKRKIWNSNGFYNNFLDIFYAMT